MTVPVLHLADTSPPPSSAYQPVLTGRALAALQEGRIKLEGLNLPGLLCWMCAGGMQSQEETVLLVIHARSVLFGPDNLS